MTGAEIDQLLADDTADIGVIFDEQHQFAAMGRAASSASLAASASGDGQRQHHQDGETLSRLAVDRDAAARRLAKP